LGLAKETAAAFPEWGAAFATMIISVIVISQLVGPPFFKWAIQQVGEAHRRAAGPPMDEERIALIFGLESQSVALARILQSNGWQVKIASIEADTREKLNESGVEIQPIAGLTREAMQELGAEKADAIVTMLSNDENYQVCELAYEHFGTEQLVVRMTELNGVARFRALGAVVVEPSTALVNLMDHFVRSPAATSLLLDMEEDQRVTELLVRNPNLHKLALRDLRLPLDVLILAINRNGASVISHGYTMLEIGDHVTVVGKPESLNEVALQFEA
jgi:Trk K+ transport system NAD-binding subunit